jgi:hypothetical protein
MLALPSPLSLPQTLTASLRLTPDQFGELCAANPDAVLELAADGSLIAMTPTGSETGARNSNLSFELQLAVRRSGLPQRRRPPRANRPAPKNGCLPGQWGPPGLVADPRAASGGGLGALGRTRGTAPTAGAGKPDRWVFPVPRVADRSPGNLGGLRDLMYRPKATRLRRRRMLQRSHHHQAGTLMVG